MCLLLFPEEWATVVVNSTEIVPVCGAGDFPDTPCSSVIHGCFSSVWKSAICIQKYLQEQHEDVLL